MLRTIDIAVSFRGIHIGRCYCVTSCQYQRYKFGSKLKPADICELNFVSFIWREFRLIWSEKKLSALTILVFFQGQFVSIVEPSLQKKEKGTLVSILAFSN